MEEFPELGFFYQRAQPSFARPKKQKIFLKHKLKDSEMAADF